MLLSIDLDLTHFAIHENDHPAMIVAQVEPGFGKRTGCCVIDLFLLRITKTRPKKSRFAMQSALSVKLGSLVI
jgi:hypothetical protein